MIDAYKDFWKRYLKFSGTSTRSQYWWTTLANLIIAMILLFPGITYGDNSTLGGIFNTLSHLYAIVITIPALALLIRRLRDAGYGPQWILIQLIPIAGPFIMLGLLCKGSKETI